MYKRERRDTMIKLWIYTIIIITLLAGTAWSASVPPRGKLLPPVSLQVTNASTFPSVKQDSETDVNLELYAIGPLTELGVRVVGEKDVEIVSTDSQALFQNVGMNEIRTFTVRVHLKAASGKIGVYYGTSFPGGSISDSQYFTIGTAPAK